MTKPKGLSRTIVLPAQVILFAATLSYIPDFIGSIGVPVGLFFLTGFLIALWRWGIACNNGTLTTGTCWSFWIVFLCITPIAQVSLDSYPWAQFLSQQAISTTLVLVTLSTIALWIGESIGQNNLKKADQKIFIEPSAGGLTGKNEENLVIAFSLIGLLFSFYCIFKIGFPQFTTNRFNFSINSLPLLGSITTAPLLLSLAGTTTAVCGIYWLLRIRRKNALRYYLWCFITLPVALFLANPLVNARFVTWSVLGSAILAFLKFRTISLAITILTLPLVLIVAFPALDYFRDDGFTRAQTTVGNLETLTTNGDFDAFQMLGNVISWTDQNGLQFGNQIVGVPLLFIPRTFWTGKPLPTGPFVSEEIGYSFTNLSSPLPAEGYIDFGIVGVILICMSWGWMMVRLDKKFRDCMSFGKSDLTVVLISIFAIYQIILLRGSLIGTAARLFPALLIVLSMPFIAKSARKSKNEIGGINRATLETSRRG